MAFRLHFLALLSIFTVHLTNACSPVEPCSSNFQCCLLIYNIGGFVVRSRCVLPAFWYRNRCEKGNNFCARNSDCGSGGFCEGASLRRWGTCSSGNPNPGPTNPCIKGAKAAKSTKIAKAAKSTKIAKDAKSTKIAKGTKNAKVATNVTKEKTLKNLKKVNVKTLKKAKKFKVKKLRG